VAESFYLPFENVLKAIVISDGCDDRSISRESNRAYGLPVFLIPDDQFRRTMLAVGGRPAIAARKNRLGAADCVLEKSRAPFDRRENVSHTLCNNIAMTLKRPQKNAVFMRHTGQRVLKHPTAKDRGLKAALPKVLSFAAIRRLVTETKAKGQRIVTTNGNFDILHIGHVRNLAFAKRQGDMLIVGINSDASVRRSKGAGRPINPASERAEVLASLRSVDAVFIYNDTLPTKWLKTIKPNVHVKGADRTLGQIPEGWEATQTLIYCCRF